MCPIANAIVRTVRPNARATPRYPIPTFGMPAARTALPQPPKTSQKVPMNSAMALFAKGIAVSFSAAGIGSTDRRLGTILPTLTDYTIGSTEQAAGYDHGQSATKQNHAMRQMARNQSGSARRQKPSETVHQEQHGDVPRRVRTRTREGVDAGVGGKHQAADHRGTAHGAPEGNHRPERRQRHKNWIQSPHPCNHRVGTRDRSSIEPGCQVTASEKARDGRHD